MARIALGALTTLNLSTHLDAMFVEIYSGAFAGFVFSGGNLGVGGTPSYGLDVLTAAASVRVAPSTTTNNALLRLTNGGGNAFVGLDGSTGGLGGAPYSLNIFRSGAYPIIFTTNDLERARFDPAGNFISRPTAAGPTLANNGEMSFQLVSNTSLKILVRGSDGTTRSATLTLA